MAFELPSLPYAMDALAPHISAETLEFHWGKHHKTYFDKLNGLVEGKPQANQSLEELIVNSKGGLFNNAAQAWNHTFYWNGMKPKGGGEASGKAGELITASFGSFQKMKESFTSKALVKFGSGWTWLVLGDEGKIEIKNTDDAGNPLTAGLTPLLTCDVWEHAYYIDYRNARPKYIEAWWNLINWDFVSANIEASGK